MDRLAHAAKKLFVPLVWDMSGQILVSSNHAAIACGGGGGGSPVFN